MKANGLKKKYQLLTNFPKIPFFCRLMKADLRKTENKGTNLQIAFWGTYDCSICMYYAWNWSQMSVLANGDKQKSEKKYSGVADGEKNARRQTLCWDD